MRSRISVGVCALSLFASCGGGGQSKVIKVGWVLPEEHPTSLALAFFEQRVEELAGGASTSGSSRTACWATRPSAPRACASREPGAGGALRRAPVAVRGGDERAHRCRSCSATPRTSTRWSTARSVRSSGPRSCRGDALPGLLRRRFAQRDDQEGADPEPRGPAGMTHPGDDLAT